MNHKILAQDSVQNRNLKLLVLPMHNQRVKKALLASKRFVLQDCESAIRFVWSYIVLWFTNFNFEKWVAVKVSIRPWRSLLLGKLWLQSRLIIAAMIIPISPYPNTQWRPLCAELPNVRNFLFVAGSWKATLRSEREKVCRFAIFSTVQSQNFRTEKFSAWNSITH